MSIFFVKSASGFYFQVSGVAGDHTDGIDETGMNEHHHSGVFAGSQNP
jgi:hypothetical protein